MRYRDAVLEPFVRLFSGAVGPYFILMDDNAQEHRLHMVDDFLENVDILQMDWPAMSLDLNPYIACLRSSGEGNCKSQFPFRELSRPVNSVAECVGPSSVITHNLPYFWYEITA